MGVWTTLRGLGVLCPQASDTSNPILGCIVCLQADSRLNPGPYLCVCIYIYIQNKNLFTFYNLFLYKNMYLYCTISYLYFYTDLFLSRQNTVRAKFPKCFN